MNKRRSPWHSIPANPERARTSSKTDKKKAEKDRCGSPRKRRIPAALIVILVLLVLLAGGALGTVYFYPNIFPGVTVGSIDVGGLSRDEAAQQIAIKSKPLYQGKKLTLTIYDADYDIPVENVLSGVDDIQSAENAWKVGREGGPLARMTAIISAMRDGCDTRLDASVDEAGLKAQLEEIAAEALTEPVAPAWKLDGEKPRHSVRYAGRAVRYRRCRAGAHRADRADGFQAPMRSRPM